MTLPTRLHPLAEDDLVDSWLWYETRQQGLGDRFLAAVGTALDLVARWPDSGTPAIDDSNGDAVERHVTTAGFPYAVRYRIIDDVIVVMAVYHQRRHPSFAQDRSP